MSMRILVTDGMDAGAMEQLRRDGFEVVEQFYEPDQLGTALRDFLQVEYGHHPQVKRLLRSPDGGATDLVLREMTE